MDKYQQVLEFHKKLNLPIEGQPTASSEKVRELYLKLLLEEVGEFATAAGIEFTYSNTHDVYKECKNSIHHLGVTDLVKMADGLVDAEYIIQGCYIVLGLPHNEIFEEVHRSNMTKRANGAGAIHKVIRGTEYSPPDIEPIIDAQLPDE